MKTAIIDLGTNTFNLLIVEGEQTLFKTNIAVKLGEGGITNNFIAEDPYRRGIAALKKHIETIKHYKVERTLALATSAIRSATNGAVFVKEVKKKLGLNIEVIDGNKEAELIYLGVQQALDLGQENNLIMDIGGGSTEFIICNKNEIFWKHSFQLGASRLLEKFQPKDPISCQGVLKLEEYLETSLNLLWDAMEKHPCNILVGSSGSFDTLAELIAHRLHEPAILNGKTTHNFNLKDYFSLHHTLLKSDLKERLNMQGMAPMRADMIVLASIFIHYLLRKKEMAKMKLSTYALKEGVLKTLR